jgi:dTDP-4-amino-4,6-dideoxygalactose transaminase
MFKEIGSNFFLDAETISSYPLREKGPELTQKARNVIYSSSGSGAISLALDQIQPKSGVALLPIYTCASVIRPFLNKGYAVEFFDIEADLSVSWNKLEEQILLYNPDVLLFHAYFGFDTHQAIGEHIAFLRKSGVAVIEDLTHSLFSGFKKSDADFHVASVRKWLPIPDGGLVFSAASPLQAPTLCTHEALVETNLKAFQEKYRYTQSLDPEAKNKYLKLFSQADQMLASDSNFYRMSDPALRIIQNTDYLQMKRSRRENYDFLLSNIKGIDFIKPVFNELPNDVVPLFFPVFVEADRRELRNHMTANEMYLPVHWPVPKRIEGQLTPNAETIYSRILSIPIDQRYTTEDMSRLADLLKSCRLALKPV